MRLLGGRPYHKGMQVVREAELPWTPIAVQRESGKEAKVLLSGVEGAADNYTLVLVREGVVATVT